MRDSCVGCPALEEKDGKGWCYYYQSWVRPSKNEGCGNSFKEKPEFTQDEYEEIAYVMADKYRKFSIEELDKFHKETGEWTQSMKDDIRNSVEKAKEEMRKRKGG